LSLVRDKTSATGFFHHHQKIRGPGRGHVGFPGADVFQVDFGVSFGRFFLTGKLILALSIEPNRPNP
jgi:hypothetical protein